MKKRRPIPGEPVAPSPRFAGLLVGWKQIAGHLGMHESHVRDYLGATAIPPLPVEYEGRVPRARRQDLSRWKRRRKRRRPERWTTTDKGTFVALVVLDGHEDTFAGHAARLGICRRAVTQRYYRTPPAERTPPQHPEAT